MTRHPILALLLTTAFSLVATAAGPPAKIPAADAEYVPGQVLVAFHDLPAPGQRASIADLVGARGARALRDRRIALLELDGMSVEEAIVRLRRNPLIKHAEPNLVYRLTREPNDPLFEDQWHHDNDNGFPGFCVDDIDTQVTRAWNLTTGSSGTVVAIFDNGLDIDHPDIVDNLWINPGEIPGNGIDDDFNGFIDDVHGWNFHGNNNNPNHGVTTGSGRGHGTMVAGIVGAVGDNGIGVAGVNWSVRLMPIKIGNGEQVYTSHAVDGLDYAIDMGVHVINNSWGGPGFNAILYDKLVEAGQAGIVVVNAAGNEGENIDLAGNAFYPASYDTPLSIAVANIRCNGDLYQAGQIGSNYGPQSVDIGAPGFRILTTRFPEPYGDSIGTSFAAPQVAGAIALLRDRFPGETPQQWIDRVMDNAWANPALDGLVAGSRTLDIFAAMAEPDSTPPADIMDLAVVESASNWVRLQWTAPGDDGTVGRAGLYDLRYSTAPIDAGNFDAATEALGEPWPQEAGGLEEMVLGGLGSSQTYHFAVKTSDEYETAANTSGISNVTSATTLPAPTVAVTPQYIDLDVDKNTVTYETIAIANAGVGVLDYAIAPDESDEFLDADAAGSLAAGQSQNEIVYVSAVDQACGPLAGTVVVTTNDPQNPQVDVAVDVDVVGPEEIEFPGGEYLEFGNVTIGEERFLPIDIYNDGCETLYILGFNSDDPDFQILSRPFSIAPESTGQIWVRFFASSLGPDSGAITIQSSDESEPFSVVTAVANVVTPPELSYSPGSFSFTGVTGQSSNQTLSLSNSGQTPLNFILQELNGSSWLGRTPEQGTVPPGASLDVSILMNAGGVCSGVYNDTLRLLTNDPDEAETFIPVSMDVTSEKDLWFQPTLLTFFVGQGNQIQTIRIGNQGCLPLTVSDVSSDEQAFWILFDDPAVIPPGQSIDVDVFYPGDAGANGTITIESDDPDSPSITIPVNAQ